jgi:hypothetical protein
MTDAKTTGVATLKTQTYEIGYSYDVEIDGELCDCTGDIVTDLSNECVKSCENNEGEWEQILFYLINEEGDPNIPYEEISNLTWEYSRKIDRRTQEYKEYRIAA